MKKKTLRNILFGVSMGALSVLPNLSTHAQSLDTKYQTVVKNGIVTFASKEEGERAKKDYDKRMEGWKNSLKSNSTELPSNIDHPMYGLNYFISAKSPFVNDFTYGCGRDPNGGDFILTQADLNTMFSLGTSTEPLRDGTWWMDIDRDGVSNTLLDQERVIKYLSGDLAQISVPGLETRAEAEENFLKELKIDWTSDISASAANWLCFDYGTQAFINFNGVYEPQNSKFAEDNGTNLQYDFSVNGVFGRPLRRVATYTINEIPHEAVVLYNGPLEDQNPKNFDYKIYVEPQNDQIQKIGSSSLNQIAHEVWHGYFNHPFEGWQYMALPLCKYSLSNGQATLTYDNSNLVTSWEPFRNNGVEDKSIQYPVSRTLEANPNVLAEAAQIVEDSEVTGILYTHHTQLTRTTTSNQDSDPTKPGHYNFEIGVTDHAKAGKYEDEGYWNITVADTESPVYNSVFKNWSDASGSPVNVTTGRDTTNKSCDGLVGKANEYEVGTDATGNSLEVLTSESDFDNRVMPVYVSSPADIEYVGNPNDANPLPDLTGAPVFSHPTGNVEINYSDETMRESSGEKDIKRTFNGTSERSDCEVSPDKTQMIYLRSGVGIEDENKGLTRKLEDKKVFQQGDTLFYNVDFADQTKFNVSISNRLGQEEKIKHYNIRSGDIYVVLDQSVSMGNKTVQARYIDGNSIKKGEKILVKEK